MKRCLLCVILLPLPAMAEEVPTASVEGQPLAANVKRVIQAFELLGVPLSSDRIDSLRDPLHLLDPTAIQEALDHEVLAVVQLNPEYRVKVTRGPKSPWIVQGGYHPFLIKIVNEATLTERLRVRSPQGGALYAGVSLNSMQRQQQERLIRNENTSGSNDRLFDFEIFDEAPMTDRLSGLTVEYGILLIYCTESGKREATVSFDVGQGTQDLGFRGELPILFDVRPAVPVKLSILDHDGTPTTAKLLIQDRRGQVYPPQPKRIAPDFFFQEQVYRHHHEYLHLAPGEYSVTSSRGPEYINKRQKLTVTDTDAIELAVQLERWINPMEYGFYCGDHHIHGAGCAHYEVPTLGVTPQDMFRQVKGEGLNVGCVLTWGPCFEFQRQYFSPGADLISEPGTILKYDLEISGFGSAPLGHVCLLNLNDQTYPGSEGTKEAGWPSWTLPVMKWAKEQGGVTGYPHSDMRFDPRSYADWILKRYDQNANDQLDIAESKVALLPGTHPQIDRDGNGRLTKNELRAFAEHAGGQLPNLVLPAMQGSGAMEIFVTTPAGVCDFISAMDTGRVGELNTWYHLLNCGFPIKVSGETDFPCMSSRRVGQGRVYVKLGNKPREDWDFGDWCRGVAAGRSYVSDGFAHALEFEVNGVRPGFGDVHLNHPGDVSVKFLVAFAPETPRAVAHGTQTEGIPPGRIGDTVELHAPRSSEWVKGGERQVEIIVNGEVVRRLPVKAGELVEQTVDIDVTQSSWIALRQFPQLHTNPVNVLVADRPIRVSEASAEWCAQAVELLWENRSHLILL